MVLTVFIDQCGIDTDSPGVREPPFVGSPRYSEFGSNFPKDTLRPRRSPAVPDLSGACIAARSIEPLLRTKEPIPHALADKTPCILRVDRAAWPVVLLGSLLSAALDDDSRGDFRQVHHRFRPSARPSMTTCCGLLICQPRPPPRGRKSCNRVTPRAAASLPVILTRRARELSRAHASVSGSLPILLLSPEIRPVTQSRSAVYYFAPGDGLPAREFVSTWGADVGHPSVARRYPSPSVGQSFGRAVSVFRRIAGEVEDTSRGIGELAVFRVTIIRVEFSGPPVGVCLIAGPIRR
jgi:hypothetical protein